MAKARKKKEAPLQEVLEFKGKLPDKIIIRNGCTTGEDLVLEKFIIDDVLSYTADLDTPFRDSEEG